MRTLPFRPSEAHAQNRTEFFKILPKVASYHANQKLIIEKAVIKGVFRRLYCCYGNLLGRENDNNVFTND